MTNIASFPSPPATKNECVIALHCSGGSGRQWRHLASALGSDFEFLAPDLISSLQSPYWSGEAAFTLRHEASRIVALIDRSAGPVHLVGHSYGGGVALRAAIERPHRVASLSLYEPTAFHVLKSAGMRGREALNEIEQVAGAVREDTARGSYRAAAQRFVDYWGGVGAFAALRSEAQGDIVRYVPKVVLDFQALLEERTPMMAYRRLRIPIRILCGEHSPAPAVLVAQRLATAMSPGALRVVTGAGHMGPFSHAEIVAEALAGHIAETGGKPRMDPGPRIQEAA